MPAILLALGAAVVFGTGTALQHRAASGVSRADVRSGRLLARLLRRPGWLAGLCLSGVAFALHVAALHAGPLPVVQPIVVTTTVFAVFVRSALDRELPDRAEIVWGLCTLAGLALFVTVVGPHGPLRPHGPHEPPGPPGVAGPPGPLHHHPPSESNAVLFVVAVVVVALVTLLLAHQTAVPARRGFLLGVGAGGLYGLTAGLIKLATAQAPLGFGPLLHHWSTWLVVPAGLSAFFLSQRAYQATRLSVSAPVLNIVDVLVAVTFGFIVFGDRLFDSAAQLLLELLGATMIGVGVWQLVKESERVHERQLEAARSTDHASTPGAAGG